MIEILCAWAGLLVFATIVSFAFKISAIVIDKASLFFWMLFFLSCLLPSIVVAISMGFATYSLLSGNLTHAPWSPR